MRILSRVALMLLPLPAFLAGQQWEVGAGAGYGLFRDVKATAGSVSGSTGFEPGVAFGALLGNQINHWVGGEARYTFRQDSLRVTSGSTKATMKGQSHALHYDVLVHATPREAAIRPFLAAGAGVKFYRGTGQETAFQPLSNLAVLTHSSEAQPLISLGGGVKFVVSQHAMFRVDFRDYLTPIPSNLLAAPPNSRISGWMHDFVFLFGVSTIF